VACILPLFSNWSKQQVVYHASRAVILYRLSFYVAKLLEIRNNKNSIITRMTYNYGKLWSLDGPAPCGHQLVGQTANLTFDFSVGCHWA